MSETLGFIGLGNMGTPIATNLLKAEFALRVYNRTASKAVAEMIGKISPLHSGYANQIADQKFEPAGFPLALGLKDVHLIMQTAAASATPMPLASLLHDRYVSAFAKGRADLDWSAIALGVAEDAGLLLRKAAG